MDALRVVSLTPDSLDWDKALRLFALRCRSLNVAPTTQALYTTHLELWRRWLLAHEFPQPAEIRAEHLRAYLDESRASGWKDATVDGAFRILRTFFRWLEREGLIVSDPMKRVERPRREEKLIRPFSEQQVRALLGAISIKTALGARDLALLALLADTGLRISEALALRIGALDLGEGSARVMGKGRRERLVPIGQTARRALLDWLKRRGDIPGCDLVFCNRFGQALKRRTLSQAIVRYGRKAGIEGVRCSAHTLRHTFAISYLRGGGDLLTLQKILGHSTLEMTRRYASVADYDAIARHRLASPLDRLGGLPNEQKRVRFA